VISDPVFREAVSAIDTGDVGALERLLAAHPRLVRERIEYGEGYFQRPYLLWFVAENPVRNGSLPENIAHVAATIVMSARRAGVESLREQLDYALGLVSSGRVARECGVQDELIDLLAAVGAEPDGALVAALAHRELAAAERLLAHGARLTLLAAVCTDRSADVTPLAQTAGPAERQLALAGAALYGRPRSLATLIDLGVDVNAYSPDAFHPHATALHHAVDSGSLDAVDVLARAGASLTAKDRVFEGTPLGWAEHIGRAEIAAYLRDREANPAG
jgi:ankyrin repeat protein